MGSGSQICIVLLVGQGGTRKSARHEGARLAYRPSEASSAATGPELDMRCAFADADFAAFCCFSPFLASRPWVRISSMLIDGSGVLPVEMVTGFVKHSTGMAGASPAACNWLHKDS